MNILFEHRSPSTDFTFNVTEKPEVPGLVEVDLYTDKKFVQKNQANCKNKTLSFTVFRFEGILVTANFGPNDDGPNLSNGQWFSSSSLKLFRTMDWYCGITHQNREPKTGKHSFFYSPFPVGNFKWKKIGFRAIVIVNDDQVHEFFIPSGTA